TVIFFTALYMLPVSAEETRNQYSKSIMFKSPTVYEDPNHKTETDLHNEYCLDLQKKIKELKYRPVRRNAARESHKAECLNK
ncbi:MAG: hypothetical protein KAR12_06245, partial [Methylococcales bacterium]|nr:hypothetical protein [Methylococcales bacterium]